VAGTAGLGDRHIQWAPDQSQIQRLLGMQQGMQQASARRAMVAADLGLLPSLRDRIRSAIEPYLSGPADSEHGLGMEDMARQIARVLEQDAT
jgi:hypothetical protein